MKTPMKNSLRRSIAAVLFLVALSPLPAQAAVSVYAEETVALSNATATTVESQVAAVAVTKAGHRKPPVRVDETGVHVGGANPVDINVPSFKHHGLEGRTDVVDIIAVVFGCSIPIVIVAIVFYARHRRLKMHHETIRAMIEKGMPIPPEMAAGTRSDLPLRNTDPRPARGDFRSGLILVAVGAALLMIAGKVGWILVFIGAARLIFWLVEDRNPKV
jgi:hypothetical protein